VSTTHLAFFFLGGASPQGEAMDGFAGYHSLAPFALLTGISPAGTVVQVASNRVAGGWFLRPLPEDEEEERREFLEEIREEIHEEAPRAQIPAVVMQQAAAQWKPSLTEAQLDSIREAATRAFLERYELVKKRRRREEEFLLLLS
jgi:hypothetical protein